MTNYNHDWVQSSKKLIFAIISLGFSEDLGRAVVKNLGSPKAMDRMTSYLHYVKPRKAELIVDEMLGIMSEIEEWRNKKESREANAAYNEWLSQDYEEE